MAACLRALQERLQPRSWSRTGTGYPIAAEAAPTGTRRCTGAHDTGPAMGLDWPRTRTIPPMRLLLQQRPDGPEAPRFVQLMLQPDLLGGWALVRESGQIGGRSQLRREQFLDRDSAMQALEQARDQQLKRGFQLMFSQGIDGRR